MKSSINRLVLVLYVLANLTMQVADSLVQIHVPEESYLNEPTSLTCSTSQAFSTIIYKAPSGNSPQCSQTGCTPVSGFQADIINSTCTQLRILRVQLRHAGPWGCADGDNNFVYRSLVVAEKNPPCSITVDTCPVLLHEKISLTVTIQNYYCSKDFNVSLRVGSVQETLSTAVHVTGPTDSTAIKEINMTKAHFGDVQLELICQKSRTISCGGVTFLHGCRPACQITSPRDTSSLRIGEDLLLNISISRYYCSDAAPLLLMMGKNDITLFNETVYYTTKEYFVVKQRMTASHFGIVKLFFGCGNFRQALLCEGVQLLSLEYDNSFCSDETGSIAAIVMGIFIIIIVVIGILILVKNLRNKNDGRKMCTVSTSTDDLEIQVTRSADKHAHDDVAVTLSQGKRNQAEDNVVVGSGGSASSNDRQRHGLRINPACVPSTGGDRVVTTGTSKETGVMGGENLHPETRGEYVALDRNAVQPSNIYEHLGTYEEIVNI
ncbi:uncharacterized protein LOC124150137 [Haliotis rufescens]|uniref:uncharacterized protein LOC124150137 n=1 Tax=Haliotis rufescens TaxID=6454 RepID=UPI00201F33B5|nr:uncharacterized protein LOC124150137 [Haliotis rufescens]